jgi:hypothetical protein
VVKVADALHVVSAAELDSQFRAVVIPEDGVGVLEPVSCLAQDIFAEPRVGCRRVGS